MANCTLCFCTEDLEEHVICEECAELGRLRNELGLNPYSLTPDDRKAIREFIDQLKQQ